jgi:ribosomal protein S18 acetylase RimI-like enzyme
MQVLHLPTPRSVGDIRQYGRLKESAYVPLLAGSLRLQGIGSASSRYAVCMTSESVVLRPAVATIDEGLLFARYLNVAADGAFRALLGRVYDRVIGEAYLSPGHDLSYETVVFAERSGRIAGMAAGYTSQQHEQSSDEPLRRAAGFRMVRMAAFSVLGRGMKTFIKTVPEGDYYLLAVAVDDQYRGSGIGTALLDYSEETGRSAGCARIVLDVAGKNTSVRHLYERRGMNVEATSPSILLVPNTRAFRMIKLL